MPKSLDFEAIAVNIVALIMTRPGTAICSPEKTRVFELKPVEVSSGLPNVKGISCLVPASWKSTGSIRFCAGNAITPAVGQFSFSSSDSSVKGLLVVQLAAGLDAQLTTGDYARLPSRVGKLGEATSFGFAPHSATQNLPPLDLSKYLFTRWKTEHPGEIGRVILKLNGPIEKSRFFGRADWHTFTRHSFLKVRTGVGTSRRTDSYVANLDWVQLGSARQPLAEGARGAWLFTEFGSFSAPEHPRHTIDQALAASILINARTDGGLFLKVAALRSAAMGWSPAGLGGEVPAGGAYMSPWAADAYYRLVSENFKRYLECVDYSPQLVDYMFNDDHLDLPPEFTRVWGAPDGSVLAATGHIGVMDLEPPPDRWHELLAQPPGEG